MRRDHRPLFVKRASELVSQLYAERFLYPQLDSVGARCRIINPRYVEVFGPDVRIGHDVHMMATRDAVIRFTSFMSSHGHGHISMGDYCIVLPGVRIASAVNITIGNNCMFATGCYVTDADWHDIYDRTEAPGPCAPVRLENNVWLGDNVTVCKGVTIGENSVIGARSVVTRDIPPNVIAAGNPARVVRPLDPEREIKKREHLFNGETPYAEYIDRFDRYVLMSNTVGDWLKSIFWPTREH